MANINQEKEELKNYQGEDRILHCEDVDKELEEEKKLKPTFEIKTKIPRLDDIIGGGFREGNLVILSGQPRMGKSSAFITLTYNFQPEKILWFSYEMTHRDLFEKFKESFNSLPEFFIPRQIQSQNSDWLRQRIIEAVVKYQIKIVFIDHLHFIVASRSQNLQQEIAEKVRMLKNLAVQLKIVIFLIVHTTKTLVEGVPALEDIRDSGMISADADYVLFILRKRMKQTKQQLQDNGIQFKGIEAGLQVAKNRRNGNCGYVNLIYDNNVFKEWGNNLKDDEDIL